jgi:hypothetical protein
MEMMKRRVYRSVWFAVLLMMVSCIKNDIPYPYMEGRVEEIVFEGQKTVNIDYGKCVVEVEMSDSYDMSSVKLSSLTLSDIATTEDLVVGEYYDLNEDLRIDIETYPGQTYPWVIRATQPIDRYITVVGQVGDAVIDTYNKKAIVYVSMSTPRNNINITSFKLGPSVATYSPSPYDIHDFTTERAFDVDYLGYTERWIVYVFHTQEVVSTGEATSVWATFADVTGNIQTGTSAKPGFDYKKKSETDWHSVPSGKVTAKGGNIKARIEGLEPETQYMFRARLGEDVGGEVEFTTDAAPTIPNLDFETGSYDDNGVVWYPNADGKNSFWATGNEGTKVAGKGNITVHTDDAVKGKAIKMTSITGVLVAKAAAGNLYTGTYKTNLMNPRSSAVLGRPYTGRPVGLKGRYKYKSAPISADKDNKYPDVMGKRDKAHIYVILEDWGGATERPENPKVIAYGEFLTDEDNSTYKEFSFDIKYNDTVTRPTHIVLSAASSYLGADFCASDGATLYVDEFELIF